MTSLPCRPGDVLRCSALAVLLLAPAGTIRAQAAGNSAGDSASAAAASLFRRLVGTWRFESRARGSDEPVASGVRALRPGFNALTLEIVDRFDRPTLEGRGFLTFDPDRHQVYVVYVHSAPAGFVTFLTGTHDAAGGVIRFTPVAVDSTQSGANAGQVPSVLRLLGGERWSWGAADGSWSAAYRRR
jgi:hypothetical protein